MERRRKRTFNGRRPQKWKVEISQQLLGSFDPGSWEIFVKILKLRNILIYTSHICGKLWFLMHIICKLFIKGVPKIVEFSWIFWFTYFYIFSKIRLSLFWWRQLASQCGSHYLGKMTCMAVKRLVVVALHFHQNMFLFSCGSNSINTAVFLFIYSFLISTICINSRNSCSRIE